MLCDCMFTWMVERCLEVNHSHTVLKAIVAICPPQRRCFLDLVVGRGLGGARKEP